MEGQECVCCGEREWGRRGSGFELTILERTLLTLQTLEESSEPFQRILSQLLSPRRQTQVLSHLPNMGCSVTENKPFPLPRQQWQGRSFSSHFWL